MVRMDVFCEIPSQYITYFCAGFKQSLLFKSSKQLATIEDDQWSPACPV
jgi:hypothetical protein